MHAWVQPYTILLKKRDMVIIFYSDPRDAFYWLLHVLFDIIISLLSYGLQCFRQCFSVTANLENLLSKWEKWLIHYFFPKFTSKHTCWMWNSKHLFQCKCKGKKTFTSPFVYQLFWGKNVSFSYDFFLLVNTSIRRTSWQLDRFQA